MQIARLFRANTAANFVRAKPPPRVYTAEELKNNKWQFPDETGEVATIDPESHQVSQVFSLLEYQKDPRH